jgi:hypothetical protein
MVHSAAQSSSPDGILPALCKIMMIRFFSAVSAALFLCSIGAFFLFVPMLSIASVVAILGGLMLMFGLGVQTGNQQLVPAESAAK